MPLSVTYALDCASGAWRLGDFPGTARDCSSNGICLQRANFCGENQPRVFLEQKLIRDERTRAFSRQLERSIDARLAYEDWYHISGTLSFLSQCSFFLFSSTFCFASPLKCLLAGRDNDGNDYHSSIPHSRTHLLLFLSVTSRCRRCPSMRLHVPHSLRIDTQEKISSREL